MPLRIAISIGDINGIGPEVALKTLADVELTEVTPVILSSRQVVDYYADQLDLELPFHYTDDPKQLKSGQVNILRAYDDDTIEISPGSMTEEGGKLAMMAVAKAADLCLSGQADALVTAPISKEAINKAGYLFPGHTEFLAEKTHTDQYMMMLVNRDLRVGLVSIHVPLAEVPGYITQSSVFSHISIMHQSLKMDFNIKEPNIAVLGLNPHAGDGGIIGTEEIEIIEPAIRKAREEGMDATGPYPGDGFFGNRKYKKCDGILAMYHDQGLIPFKTLSFGTGVNFTAGLPIIRTSPDHGTAFDIAGKNLADPSSFRQAFELAGELARNRKRQAAEYG